MRNGAGAGEENEVIGLLEAVEQLSGECVSGRGLGMGMGYSIWI